MKDGIQLWYLARPLLSLILAGPQKGQSWIFVFSLLSSYYEVIWGKETYYSVW